MSKSARAPNAPARDAGTSGRPAPAKIQHAQVNGHDIPFEDGTTLAAALWNAGISCTRHSSRGDPRGPLCGMGICFECRATVNGDAHERTCVSQTRTARPPGTSIPNRAEVAIIGAGPAGIAAACIGAEAGASVVLVDESPTPGGQIWRHRGAPPKGALSWLRRLERANVTRLQPATVFDADATGRLWIDAEGTRTSLRFDRLILATGARERFLPFPGWTLPNVLGVGGAQALYKSGARFDGRRVVIAGSGPLLLPVAAALAKAGAKILCVAEQAPATKLARLVASLVSSPRKLRDAASYRLAFRDAPYFARAWVVAAEGDDAVRSVVLQHGAKQVRFECDVLACAFGLVPNLELPRHLGCELDQGWVRVDHRQETSVPHVFCAGEPTGIGGLDSALVEGAIAAHAALDRPIPNLLFRARERHRNFARHLAECFALRPELRTLSTQETIVCRCEDVTLGQLRPEWPARAAKLYTRVGMGACQGRVCSPALEFLYDWTPDTVRSPLKPVALDALEVDV